MMLITLEQHAMLLANGKRQRIEGDFDPFPVVKLFTPDAQAIWLLIEIDPHDPDLAFGLCDLGLGSPELGTVSLAELTSLRGPLGLRVERDRYFKPDRPLSAYTAAARRAGRIIT